MNFKHSTPAPVSHTPAALAEHIHATEPEVVDRLRAIIHHPRSLARESASWRPPTKRLPWLPQLSHGTELTIAITRRRVGPRAQARIRGFGETRVPAFLIEVRISDPSGLPTDRRLAEAWVRALVPRDAVDAIHELPSPRTANYVWLTDGDFAPVASPPSMFEGLTAA
ncbi:hypothetical protein CIMIT_04650 [Corynebacterium imitans]|nr:hypothetical protein CIMIT_04650 [Corynebacterium imitans]